MKFNILIVGIGGQGVVLIADILRQYLFSTYPNATITGTESRGVSQREGSVIASIRFDDENNNIGPEIPKNNADLIIALEPIELMRYLDYSNENTIVILNRAQIIPKNALPSIQKNVQENEKFKPFYLDQKKIVEKISNILLEFFKSSKSMDIGKETDSKPICYISWDHKKQTSKKSSRRENHIESFSAFKNLIDVDLSNYCLKSLDSLKMLNFLTLGFTIKLVESPLKYEELMKFLSIHFNLDEKSKRKITPNLTAMDLGAKYAEDFMQKIE